MRLVEEVFQFPSLLEFYCAYLDHGVSSYHPCMRQAQGHATGLPFPEHTPPLLSSVDFLWGRANEQFSVVSTRLYKYALLYRQKKQAGGAIILDVVTGRKADAWIQAALASSASVLALWLAAPVASVLSSEEVQQ